MSHLDESRPLPAYILAPLAILQQRVSAEIALVIIDYAEIWERTTAVRDLRGPPSSVVKITERTKQAPFLSATIASRLDTSVVRKIVFRTQAHDQGWSIYVRADPSMRGSLDSPYTWLEARVRPDACTDTIRRLPRRLIQANPHAVLSAAECTNTWELRGGSPDLQAWMGQLRAGDVLDIMPRAVTACWVNYVQFAQIDVYCAV